MKLSLLPGVALALSFALPAAAAPEKWNVYPLLNDPVGGEPLADVEEPVVRVYEDRRFHFASDANADAFEADPGAYVPAVDERLITTQSEGYPKTTCPVSGEPLDAMGAPVDVLLGFRLVKLCCAGCEAEAQENPEAAIDKLDAAVVAEQGPGHAAETCPVTGLKLGSMGEPVDFVFAGELVRFCCGGCVSNFLANPAQILAELEGAGA